MKIEKNKIVFGSIVVIVTLFLAAYSLIILLGEEEDFNIIDQPMVPELKEEKEQYTSKKDALDDLKEERTSNPPSIYSEKLLDSLGVYDPALEENEREKVIDSIYRHTLVGVVQDNRYDHEDYGYEDPYVVAVPEKEKVEPEYQEVILKDLASGHDQFFLTAKRDIPSERPSVGNKNTGIRAEVNGTQKVRTNDRLELLLKEDVEIAGKKFKKNTIVYAFVRIQPNRIHLQITHVAHQPVKLKVYDFQDSNQGIYIENSFKAQAGKQVLADVVDDITIAGLPQLKGIKDVFRKDQRDLRITVLDQYQLILKPEL